MYFGKKGQGSSGLGKGGVIISEVAINPVWCSTYGYNIIYKKNKCDENSRGFLILLLISLKCPQEIS